MPIVVKDLWHVYSSGTPFEITALKGVNLQIEDNSFVAIIGQTGSGKSTLVQHFNGLILPFQGSVTIGNIDVSNKTDRKLLRQQVGLVFQFPEHQLFEETVYLDIAFGPKNMGLSEDVIENRVNEAIEVVGLSPELLTRSPFDLSGGQMRRVALAGVIAMQPKILVLDEPTAGLDPRGRDDILALIQRLHHERQISVILVSHSMEDVAKVAKRIIVMHQGQVFLDGTPKEVFSRGEQLQQIGLDIPQVAQLGLQLKQRGFPIPDVLLTVDEAKQAIAAAFRRTIQ